MSKFHHKLDDEPESIREKSEADGKYLMCARCKNYWRIYWRDTQEMVAKIKMGNICKCCGSREIVLA